jgi:hypothetical protein
MGRGMTGVRREGTETCGVYAGVRLVGRRGAAALRPVAPGKRVGKAVPRHMDRRAEAGLGMRAQGSRGAGQLKDRLGYQRGGSEWEPIKILLEGD